MAQTFQTHRQTHKGEPTLSIEKMKLAPLTLTAVNEMQANLPEYEMQPVTGMHYDSQAKYLTWKFDTKRFPDGIEIIHLTDVQFGHICCNIKQVKAYMAWILSVPNRFVVLGGDMIDAANVLSVGSPYENLFDTQSQVYKFCELFAPLRARILGYCGGNHERRGVKTFGDLGVLIATLLRIPYSAGQQFVNINYGKHKKFTIFLWHGRGAARTVGAKMMMVYYAMKELSGGAEVTLVGHLHTAMMTWATNRVHDETNNKVIDKKTAGAMSSSFLDYFGGYGEIAGMSPNDIIMARVDLTPNGKWGISIR
jgi:hypothetical protein